jgi:hypothetical protein
MTGVMRVRLAVAFLVLVASFTLQFWFASANIFIDFILTALILFAFYFEIWELLVFIFLSFYVVAWAPLFNVEIILFCAIPLLVYTFHKIVALERWAGIPIAVIVGLIVFYAGSAPQFFFSNLIALLLDIFGSLIFAAAVFAIMNKTERR